MVMPGAQQSIGMFSAGKAYGATSTAQCRQIPQQILQLLTCALRFFDNSFCSTCTEAVGNIKCETNVEGMRQIRLQEPPPSGDIWTSREFRLVQTKRQFQLNFFYN
jgi:hypothetical protein